MPTHDWPYYTTGTDVVFPSAALGTEPGLVGVTVGAHFSFV